MPATYDKGSLENLASCAVGEFVGTAVFLGLSFWGAWAVTPHFRP